jgi:hypothetical protein
VNAACAGAATHSSTSKPPSTANRNRRRGRSVIIATRRPLRPLHGRGLTDRGIQLHPGAELASDRPRSRDSDVSLPTLVPVEPPQAPLLHILLRFLVVRQITDQGNRRDGATPPHRGSPQTAPFSEGKLCAAPARTMQRANSTHARRRPRRSAFPRERQQSLFGTCRLPTTGRCRDGRFSILAGLGLSRHGR